ncbi:hypothetical protein [Paenibacillus medicaginis]|uniref:DUF5673 domain-containing protein n=1 Tax=Paenibacillus medicaginis TaxID=1470560 RepID=A0ABV5BXN4_9BACL
MKIIYVFFAFIVSALLFLILGPSILFNLQRYFLSWLINRFLGVLGGMVLVGLVFQRFEKDEYNNTSPAKDVWIKIFSGLSGAGLILFCSYKSYLGVQDLGSYFTKNYQIVHGTADDISSRGRAFHDQEIEINGTVFTSYRYISPSDTGKFIEITYLPNSRYVLNVRVIE